MCCLVHKLVSGNEPVSLQSSGGVQAGQYQVRFSKLGTLFD